MVPDSCEKIVLRRERTAIVPSPGKTHNQSAVKVNKQESSSMMFGEGVGVEVVDDIDCSIGSSATVKFL